MKPHRSNFASRVSPANGALIRALHHTCRLLTVLVEEDMLVKVHLLVKDLVLQAQLPILFQKVDEHSIFISW